MFPNLIIQFINIYFVRVSNQRVYILRSQYDGEKRVNCSYKEKEIELKTVLKQL